MKSNFKYLKEIELLNRKQFYKLPNFDAYTNKPLFDKDNLIKKFFKKLLF